MATMITEDCIACGACEEDCPTWQADKAAAEGLAGRVHRSVTSWSE